jgi:uncharacterized oxidoreductase
MKINGNTILITGGATGIGLALAEAFVEAGSEVIVCARTEENLKQAKKKSLSYMSKSAIFLKNQIATHCIPGQLLILRI